MSKPKRIWTPDDIINYESIDPRSFKPKAGQVYVNLPNELYHAQTEFKGSTLLRHGLKSKEHYEAAKKVIQVPTMPMEIGSAFHDTWQRWLEEQKLEVNAVVTTAKVASDKWLKEKKDNPGKLVISEESIQMIEGMCIKMEQNRLIEDDQGGRRDLFDNGYSELSFFGTFDGVKVKVRPDFTRFDLNWLFDWKTCQSAVESDFAKEIANRLYHFQMVFYGDVMQSITGITFPHYVIVAIEKTEPYYLKYYYLDDDTVETARVLISEALMTIKHGDKQTDLEPISLPIWARRV